MGETIVKVENLTKRYGKQSIAVDHLNMNVRKGEVYGFLGPNGAGKTTTLRMLLGLTRPTSGTGEVLGKPLGSSDGLAKVGGLIEYPAFYPYLSGRKNLIIMAKYSGTPLSRVDVVLEEVEMTKSAKYNFKSYSLGMKQRIGIAAALLKDPELLVLDEPTNGLDPKGMAEIRSLIRKLSKEGRTVLLSSHFLGEVEQICDRIGVIQNGKLVKEGTVEDLRGQVKLFIRATPAESALRVLKGMKDIDDVQEKDGAFYVTTDPSLSGSISHKLAENKIEVSELRNLERSLEDIFIELTESETLLHKKEVL
ncbi:ABC transporter ATP-binding protein [Oceanobacillus manasiensis]|uniref:ABC transporter ATP-binding protein n=1 Tax=Oceanobacillus manasiensis TaxID=586413 RepID=UPI0005AAB361|nr:ATP-binding cassette domain-containing protein [Oceanobacillus manasiensis]